MKAKKPGRHRLVRMRNALKAKKTDIGKMVPSAARWMYSIFNKIGMIIQRPYRDKVPQTMQFIESAVESDEAFRIRRIMWTAEQFIKNGENATRHKLLELASINNKFRYSNGINKAIDEALLWIKSASKNYEH